MNFLIDAQLPPALCYWLRERGHDARHITDVLPGATPDEAIASYTEQAGLILISKDEDFLRLSQINRFILIWLRCGNVTNRVLYNWLEPRWLTVEQLLDRGERLIEVR